MVFCRKRKDNRTSNFILDDSPKRTKVQAQRKFAQGTNINSPVLTPVNEVGMQEKVLPEPVELLPMKRPNTEDFLTFLCFRGTPALPPNLNFFNNASMIDASSAIAGVSSNKNGVIFPNSISSRGQNQGEKPFIAFGVRKRADPIVVSRHMDKKRRHALALQTLRRKYQEQKMAKIRAITISKLSEKVQTNSRTIVRTTRSVTKPETGAVSKKNIAQKSKTTVVATKRVVTRRSSTPSRQNLRSMKSEMCLRGLRGRIVTKRDLLNKMPKKKPAIKKQGNDSFVVDADEDSEVECRDGEKKKIKGQKVPTFNEIAITKKVLEDKTLKNRVTRSNPFTGSDQNKSRRILLRRQVKLSKSPSTSPKTKPQLQRKIANSTKQDGSINQRQINMKSKNLSKKIEINETLLISKPNLRKVKDVVKKKGDNENNTTKSIKKSPVTSVGKNSKDCCGESNKIAKLETRSSAGEFKELKNQRVFESISLLDDKKEVEDKCTVESKNKAENKIKIENKNKVEERNKFDNKNKVEDKNKIDDIKKPDKVNKQEDKKKHQREIKFENKNQTPNKKQGYLLNKEKEESDIHITKTKSENILQTNKVAHNKKVPVFLDGKKIKIDDVIIEELEPKTKNAFESPKHKKRVTLKAKPTDDSVENKIDSENTPVTTRRPSRKTKLAAALYMEILGRKLINDEAGDDISNDSFPELPSVKKTELREIELKALKSKAKKVNKEEEHLEKNSKKSRGAKVQYKESENTNSNVENVLEKRKTRNHVSKQNEEFTDSDDSFTAEIKTPPLKMPPRNTRKTSPKLYKSFTDTDSEESVGKMRINKEAPQCSKAKMLNRKAKVKRTAKSVDKKVEGSFSDSDEEPLSKFANKSEDKTPQLHKQNDETTIERKQKRECTKRGQNYVPLLSSSEDDILSVTEKVALEKPAPATLACADSTEVLSTKDLGKRFGKGKVNMSNAQIEKWLNDSVMAGISLIKKENDEMLKFGERIPTETSLNNTNLNSVNMEQLKSSLLLVSTKKESKKIELTSSFLLTPEKSSVIETQKPISNEKKTIFKKQDSFSKNSHAFSVCNESSVYAFEADNEDSVSTPFRRPSRRPSSTATSRSEDEINCESKANKFRHPDNVVTSRIKQEVVSLMLTDESNHSESITVQVNIENSDSASKPQNSSNTENEHMFYIPLKPGQKSLNNIQGVAIKMGTTIENTNPKLIMSAKLVRQCEKTLTPPMCPPSNHIHIKKELKSRSNLSEDDFKYKVPSSPSASSSSSAKLVNKKYSTNDVLFKPINFTEFPANNKTGIVEAPIFKPTEKEFLDPLEYIEKIRGTAEKFGICRIIPPVNFKPECKVLDEMRFTAYNQYVHKMMYRCGPNFKEFIAIRKCLATQTINLKHPPWIGGMEVDLPKLYQTVQTLGGPKEVIEKKKWPRVAELMKIPKSAQDRVTKLDDIYCKYLLPYATLSSDEREKLFKSVENDWAKREEQMFKKAQGTYESDVDNESEDDEDDVDDENDIECIVKGRSMALSAFYRIARNTMAMWFKCAEPAAEEVEEELWKHLIQRKHHICVHSGSIDSGNLGYGFAISKNSPFARHAWNLKVLTNNSSSILRSMGPVMGLTVPTLHVGMVFAGCCWYRDPHSLPWIEYLHTGANKIWYSIPDSMSEKFHSVMLKLVPNYCLNKSLWLPTDTVMVPPNILVEHGISLCRTVQEPGQFIIVFPKAFTSNICTGYVVSESVFWAPVDWLSGAEDVFLKFRNSCEPSMFSFERLLLSIAADTRSDICVLKKIIPLVEAMIEREKRERTNLRNIGVTKSERLSLLDPKRKKKMQDTDTEYICEDCRWNLYCSMVTDNPDNGYYCLEHAVQNIQSKNLESENCKLIYTFDDCELNSLIKRIESAIEAKILKKTGSKFSGMATLLNR